MNSAQALKSIFLLFLLTLNALGQTSDFTFTTNDNDTITVTGYIGSGGTATIPNMVTDLTVTQIGTNAFFGLTSVSCFIIPSSITNIEDEAFLGCSVTNIYFQGNAPSLGFQVFGILSFSGFMPFFAYPNCYYLPGTTGWDSTLGGCPVFLLFPPFVCISSNGTISIQSYIGSGGAVVIPSSINGLSVTRIESQVFFENAVVTSVTIPSSVESIGYQVFGQCPALTSVYFAGNAPDTDTPPSFDWTEFSNDNQVTAYYLPGTTGWGTVFGDGPTADGLGTQGGANTALWLPAIQAIDARFGIQSNHFGFNINWASGQTVVVEGCTDLANQAWSPLQTNTICNGIFNFSDSQWMNYPSRFYRVISQ